MTTLVFTQREMCASLCLYWLGHAHRLLLHTPCTQVVFGLAVLYPLAGPLLYTYMFKQRSKRLGGSKAKSRVGDRLSSFVALLARRSYLTYMGLLARRSYLTYMGVHWNPHTYRTGRGHPGCCDDERRVQEPQGGLKEEMKES